STMRICMFVYNRCTTDARVLKEADSLAGAGHEVRIVAVLDPTTAVEETLTNGVRINRIDRRPLHYRLAWWGRARRRSLRLLLGGAGGGVRRAGGWVGARLRGEAPPADDDATERRAERSLAQPPRWPAAPAAVLAAPLVLLAKLSTLIRKTLYRA